MIVKCIDPSSRLVNNKTYKVKVKVSGDTFLTLVNVPGTHKISRFVTLDGHLISVYDNYINHNLYVLTRQDYKYVKVRSKSKLKLNKEVFYEIERIYWIVKQFKIKGIENPYSYKNNNFLFFTEEEVKVIRRKDKIKKLINKKI
ncbi:MAG: hypothetical protein ACOCVF_03150 [bacterium]